MRHHGSIAGVEVVSDASFVVFGPCRGVVAECQSLAEAREAFARKVAELKACNAVMDCAIFRWSRGGWRAAINPYDLQELEIAKNPSSVVDYA